MVSIFEDDLVFDINTIVSKQLAIIGCNVYETRHIQQAAKLLADGSIDPSPLVTDTCDLADCGTPLQHFAARIKKHAKSYFKWRILNR